MPPPTKAQARRAGAAWTDEYNRDRQHTRQELLAATAADGGLPDGTRLSTDGLRALQKVLAPAVAAMGPAHPTGEARSGGLRCVVRRQSGSDLGVATPDGTFVLHDPGRRPPASGRTGRAERRGTTRNARGERTAAARALLVGPWRTAQSDPVVFPFIRRHADVLDRWFPPRLGYRLGRAGRHGATGEDRSLPG